MVRWEPRAISGAIDRPNARRRVRKRHIDIRKGWLVGHNRSRNWTGETHQKWFPNLAYAIRVAPTFYQFLGPQLHHSRSRDLPSGKEYGYCLSLQQMPGAHRRFQNCQDDTPVSTRNFVDGIHSQPWQVFTFQSMLLLHTFHLHYRSALDQWEFEIRQISGWIDEPDIWGCSRTNDYILGKSPTSF